MKAPKFSVRPPLVHQFREMLPKPEINGRFMTLCIAAIACNDKKIAMVSDFMLSGDGESWETRGNKFVRAGHTGKWISMFAGCPSHAKFIWSNVQRILEDTKKERGGDMGEVFSHAFRCELKQSVEDNILSPLGLNLEQFLNARLVLGDEAFNRILEKVKETMLETIFLICGFDAGGPHILSVSDPGTASIHDQAGFCSIGCGFPQANAALAAGEFSPLMPINEIIYRILDAKFRSEIVMGVGRRTIVSILCEDGTQQQISADNVEASRKLWRERQKPPPESEELIDSILENHPRK